MLRASITVFPWLFELMAKTSSYCALKTTELNVNVCLDNKNEVYRSKKSFLIRQNGAMYIIS